MNKDQLIKRWNPAVSQPWLLLEAGLMWSAVGILLGGFAFRWMASLQPLSAAVTAGFSLTLAFGVYRLGFGRLAKTNIRRVKAGPEKMCAFAFLPWKSYLVAAGMMAFGIALRGSTTPRIYLAGLYTMIGGGLFLSSLEYYQSMVWRTELGGSEPGEDKQPLRKLIG